MATGPEQYAKAEECLGRLPSLEYGSHEAHEQLLEAQVRAMLALAAATAVAEGCSMPGVDFDAWYAAVGVKRAIETPRVWWVDDGQENPGKPPLYTSEPTARDAAIKRFEHDNPFTDTFPGIVSWQRPQDEDDTDDAELSIKGRRTGIFVRPLQPKDGA